MIKVYVSDVHSNIRTFRHRDIPGGGETVGEAWGRGFSSGAKMELLLRTEEEEDAPSTRKQNHHKLCTFKAPAFTRLLYVIWI